MAAHKRVLTGIKPTGTPHLGNFVGAIRPSIALAHTPGNEAFLFVADAHALTGLPKGKDLQQNTFEVIASWIACGLDTEKVIVYRQSQVREVFELNWLFTCLAPKGLINRAHAYKAAVQNNLDKGLEDVDVGISMGLYQYPILMAADILLFNPDMVPVGQDQVQHIEIARDLAVKFNQTFDEIFRLPEAFSPKTAPHLTGLDGRKMSKSYNNTIPLFASSAELKKLVKRIKTNSQTPEEPKDAEACPLFSMYQHFATQEEVRDLRSRYQTGIGWGTVKELLFEVIEREIAPKRATYETLMQDKIALEGILKSGEEKARVQAQALMQAVRQKIGFF